MATIGVTRGLGDHDLKVHDSNIYIKPFLSSSPEVKQPKFNCLICEREINLLSVFICSSPGNMLPFLKVQHDSNIHIVGTKFIVESKFPSCVLIAPHSCRALLTSCAMVIPKPCHSVWPTPISYSIFISSSHKALDHAAFTEDVNLCTTEGMSSTSA